MTALRVAVLGGGPAGLTAARLLKCQQPTWDVTLFERQPPESTFGYGVGLGWGALKQLREADSALVDDLEAATLGIDTWTIRRDNESISAGNSHGLGIARADLLSILQQHAAAAGVSLRLQQQVSLADVVDADVVIAADGVGSETRQLLADELGASVTQGELAYLWGGAALSLDGMTLSLVRTPAGPIAAHVMPYGAAACTFQVDTRQAVVDSWDLASAEADAGTIAVLEAAFADLLQGAQLVAKKSQWSTFPTVTCERWSSGNVVLLGDAVHTAHYSVGSGTGLAVEDAVQLAEALGGSGSLEEAFAAYQLVRQPRVAKLQGRADRSQRWWTSLDLRIDAPLPQLLLSYLTRTGAITLTMVLESNADLVQQCLPLTAGASGDLVDRVLTGRVIEPDADIPTLSLDGGTARIVDRALDLATRGVTTVRLVGPAGRDAVLDRLELAERLREQAKVSTVVAGPPQSRDDLALGILTGHTDLIEFSSSTQGATQCS